MPLFPSFIFTRLFFVGGRRAGFGRRLAGCIVGHLDGAFQPRVRDPIHPVRQENGLCEPAGIFLIPPSGHGRVLSSPATEDGVPGGVVSVISTASANPGLFLDSSRGRPRLYAVIFFSESQALVVSQSVRADQPVHPVGMVCTGSGIPVPPLPQRRLRGGRLPVLCGTPPSPPVARDRLVRGVIPRCG